MTATLQELKPSQIAPHKHNPRRDVGDVAELADSIKAKGMLEPLIVAPNGTGKFPTFLLIAGHRRLAAAKAAKLKTVPCLVRADLLDEQSQIETMLVENLQRADLSPIEEAEAYQQLLAFPGYTQAKIAGTTGRAIATVRGRLKLAKLPDSTREKIHAGQISMTDANILLEFVADKTRYQRLEKAIGTSSWPYELQRVRQEQQTDRRAAKTRKELETDGVRVLNTRPMAGVLRLFQPNIDQHRDCEGFAAYIGYGGTAEYVCTKPELHRPDDDDEGTGTARRTRFPNKTDDLVNAAAHRRAHILAVLAGNPSGEHALESLRDRIREDLVEDYLPDWIIPVFDLPDGYAEADDCAELIDQAIAKLTLYQLAALLDFGLISQRDEQLEYDQWGKSTEHWRARLVRFYGYKWTPAEQAALVAAGEDAEDAGGGS